MVNVKIIEVKFGLGALPGRTSYTGGHIMHKKQPEDPKST
jgi:hypothetical protein